MEEELILQHCLGGDGKSRYHLLSPPSQVWFWRRSEDRPFTVNGGVFEGDEHGTHFPSRALQMGPPWWEVMNKDSSGFIRLFTKRNRVTHSSKGNDCHGNSTTTCGLMTLLARVRNGSQLNAACSCVTRIFTLLDGWSAKHLSQTRTGRSIDLSPDISKGLAACSRLNGWWLHFTHKLKKSSFIYYSTQLLSVLISLSATPLLLFSDS